MNLRRLFCAVAVFGVLLSGCTEKPEAVAKNLLVICIDTVRADTFYALGEAGGDALSPWEEKGVVFEQANAAAPWTLPSIASLFSGVWVPQHGGGRFKGMYGKLAKAVPGRIHDRVPLLAEVLREEEDFETAIFTASPWTSRLNMGLKRGFDQIESFEHMKKMETDYRPIVDKWKEQLDQQGNGDRTFHYVHFMDAHEWHMSGQEELNATKASLSSEELALYQQIAPAGICEDDGVEGICNLFTVYAHAVKAQRDAIAEMLEALQARNLLDDTVVVVFSDHGEEFHDHVGDGRDISGRSYFAYFGHGMTLYQEQLRVPLLIWSPNAAGRRVESPVSLVDVAPTVARWLGVNFVPKRWPGHYLDDYLQSANPHPDRVIYATGVNRGPNRVSARQGSEKSIWNLVTDVTRYFDLEKDPYEQFSKPTDELVMRFDGLFVDFLQHAPEVKVEQGVLTDEQIRRLQSIGYLQGLEPADGE